MVVNKCMNVLSVRVWALLGVADVRYVGKNGEKWCESTIIDIECSYTLRYYLRVVYLYLKLYSIFISIYTLYIQYIQCIYNSNNWDHQYAARTPRMYSHHNSDIYLTYQPSHYFSTYLTTHKTRPDSRTPSQHRPTRISITPTRPPSSSCPT